jgi:hypothetical protein
MNEETFNHLYKRLPNGKVQKKPLNFTEQYVRDLKRWLLDKTFDYMVTYRPKQTKVTGFNAPQLFDKALMMLPNVTDILWSLEGDWNGKSNHCHLLIGGKLTKKELANAMNRAQVELPYFEKIKSKEDAIGYVTKYGKTDAIRAFNYLNKDKLFTEIDSRYVFDNLPHNQNFYKHPNHYYHQRANLFAELINGRYS